MLLELRSLARSRSAIATALGAGMLVVAGCVSSLNGLDDTPGGGTGDGGDGADGETTPTSPPTLAPSKIAFRDADPRQSFVGGDIAITPAATPDGVTEYRAYFGTSGAARIGTTPIGTSSTPTLTLTGVAVPDGATNLLVFAANALGEAPVSASIALRDNYAHYVDISGTLDYIHNYAKPSAAIAPVAKQLYVISEGRTNDGSNYNNLLRCALDGTACSRMSLPTASLLAGTTLFIDETLGMLMFTGFLGTNGTVNFVHCKLDGTACALGMGTGYMGSGYTGGAIDTTNKYLYMFYSSISAHPAFVRSTYDGGTSVAAIFGGTGEPKTGFITAGKVYMVEAGPTLLTSGPIGENQVAADIGAGAGVDAQDVVAIEDSKNQKLLVAARNNSTGGANKLALFRCDLTGANCKYTDASSGQPLGSGKTPSVAIDATRDKLYIAAQNETGRPGLYRCNVDATGCAYVDITAGQPVNSGGLPKIVIDTVNDRILVVTQVGTTDLRAGLFSLDLW